MCCCEGLGDQEGFLKEMSELSPEETVQVKRWRKVTLGKGTMWAEAQRCENTAIWEYHVWGVGGRDRYVDRARLGKASYGSAEELKFHLESMRET